MDYQYRSSWTQINPDIRSKIVKSITTNNSSPSSNNKAFSKSSNNNAFCKNCNPISSFNLHDITLYDLLMNFHVSDQPDLTPTDDTITTTEVETTNTTTNETTSQGNDQLLIQEVKISGSNATKPQHSPADVRNLLSKKNTRSVNTHVIIYKVKTHDSSSDVSLVDKGANGGIAGNNVRVVEKLHRHVDVQGIDKHKMNDIPIVTATGVTKTQRGEVILILNQYAYVGKGTSIHSSPQIESYSNNLDDRSTKVGGRQLIETIDGYYIPLNIKNSLPRMNL